ncbi:response regulator [Cohnella zeiphila]|uniref:Response regulator n=1 Tax=Cohnella zeiphila TaxID=2761120 RepID=A0A7X0SNF1_9BACL|nr:response regulator [Cohnella zeiphila]MBB6733126.1 response regulator [Cohnella zeiphila]
MYKALIIDDEEPSREAIRILGDWEGLGVREVREAGDGRAGLAMLQEWKPDLVLVDMKMPEMNGMEFLQNVERDYPNLFTIVISGYNDFEFTRQAIRSRVVDYLLKPVNRADLNQALRKAIGVLEARKESENEDINRNITLNLSVPKLKENIIFQIIERNLKVRSNESFLRLIGADDPDKRFGTSAVLLLNPEATAAARFKRERDLLSFAVTNVIHDFAEEGFQSFSFPHPKREREIVVFHTLTGGHTGDLGFRSAHFMKKVVAALRDLFGLTVVVGIGAPAPDISKLADSFESAEAAAGEIDLLKLGGGGTVVQAAPRADSPPPKETPSFAGRIGQLRGAIDGGHANQARTVVADYVKKLRSLDALSLREAGRLLGEFVFLLGDLALEYGVQENKLADAGESSLRAIGLSSDYADIDQYEALLLDILTYYAGQIRAVSSAERPFDVHEIKEYIDQHYFEDIKISMFTEKYYLSREYLMKLFKQQYGFGIHEYVQKIRMEKAKELLGHSDLKIQEISEMLGYKDKNYFSKAFRNYYSLSPSEYRTGRTDG